MDKKFTWFSALYPSMTTNGIFTTDKQNYYKLKICIIDIDLISMKALVISVIS